MFFLGFLVFLYSYNNFYFWCFLTYIKLFFRKNYGGIRKYAEERIRTPVSTKLIGVFRSSLVFVLTLHTFSGSA